MLEEACSIYLSVTGLFHLAVSSSFIYIMARDRISLLLKAEYYSTGGMDPILFIRSPVDGRLGCFHRLAPVKKAAMSMNVQTPVQDPVFDHLHTYPEVGLPDRMVLLPLTL